MVPWWLVFIGVLMGFLVAFPMAITTKSLQCRQEVAALLAAVGRPLDLEDVAALHAEFHGREKEGPGEWDRAFAAAVIALKHPEGEVSC